MKIIHIADTHIGATPFGKRELGEDVDRFVNWIRKQLDEIEPDLLILAGDTFDTPCPTAADVAWILRLMESASRNNCLVSIVDGNHDSMKYSKLGGNKARRKTSWSSALAAGFPTTVIRSIDMEETPPEEAEPFEMACGTRVLALDYAPGPVVRKWAEGAKSAGLKTDILVCHQSAEWATGGIFAPELEIGAFDGIASYVALGDIHKLNIEDGKLGTTYLYPGPSTWMKESESGQEGAVLIEIEKGGEKKITRLARENRRLVVEAEIRKSESGGYELISTTGFFTNLCGRGLDLKRAAEDLGGSMFGVFSVRTPGPKSKEAEVSKNLLVRILYPHDSEVVTRPLAYTFGSELAKMVCDSSGVKMSIVVVADPVDGIDVRAETNMADWVRNTASDQDSVFSDSIVESAIEETAMELSADDEFSEKVADLAKKVWADPSRAKHLLR